MTPGKMNAFSFAHREWALQRAASTGTSAAADILVAALRGVGLEAKIASRLDGTASVTLEGAGAISREFGTRMTPARPVLGPLLRESRAAMLDAMARSIGQSLRSGR